MGKLFKMKPGQIKKIVKELDEATGLSETEKESLESTPGFIDHETGVSFNGRGIVGGEVGINIFGNADLHPKAGVKGSVDIGSSVSGDGGFTIWTVKRARYISPLGIGAQVHAPVLAGGAPPTPAGASIPAPSGGD